ncbi:hypothetical protein A3H10_02720 [Candidatus Uhrbacteria bacterium RIFCSPLOWO2_12_FULL_46_10]|uniref:Transcriptional regulator n=1 Tax=Candidatus Uhrbacteria bacterium RIFCSPLOWO2_01_FULL_47_25 TaxID=1802402 RepID=A0A1F7UV46_9BACT|nr:MAG: hypothetical protein UX68_C0011G0018 [Parcubacteria group bacterium GW2011_GWA2_46_9]OGL59058.1 MAG: hypothetical protein A2752_02480 [Candidatus Uhrbacteria bacterium RIFCSPHIGHO2_01_FULL_46_23]OGL68725.1 MAG: hypothetical protein A3D60_02085 [Candidatus Uhrbacteria bacterium RIFCSPHIGHO2_02_FULL_47_29]OGL74751.1 MAG: hypothetical protein A3E96_03370 [Candidatus Uhrbacteria bacterium RIFCSPHIGHO2_12_FULL_46_13]OGL82162.1 MAG: hypothetical protein A2936_01200 [Candidatus Uhrbacteria bac
MNKKTRLTAIRRLKILEGQVRGLQRMVENDTYCIQILHQSSAIKEALCAIEDLILEHHIATHVIEQIKSGKEQRSKKELMEVYRLCRRH